jgi:hypothetical protein
MRKLLLIISFGISFNAMSNSDTVIVECVNIIMTGMRTSDSLSTPVNVKASSATLDGCPLSILPTSVLRPNILHLQKIENYAGKPCVYTVQDSALRETYLCSNIR